ncbi:Aste57867_8592 [Aphanomyces stellatus]|uniref:KIF-binding protein n=1 Tax=Aphanomyces stellatus TaxID=120398 RepID=A0A485KKP0_9STRA|nr:hypothetical protein As57867_008560 [Aphanomyces stellatus]VFT85478.1 Aste57867_8592 [Aphanomyces stellatus]
MAAANDVVKDAKRLLELEAPEETPYVHLYEARDSLLEALRNDPQSIPLHSMLGQVYLAAEEPHEAQPVMEKGLMLVPGSAELIEFCNKVDDDATLESLTSTLPEFDTPESFDAHRADIMDILNQLGILWFNRTSHGRAYCYFKTAESMFLYSSEPGMRPTYTHTLFYLAQLYGHLNAPEKSAMYCQLTLRHQLDDQKNLPPDWVQNCLHLSEYFLKQNQLPKASQCIHACTTVGAQPKEEAQIAANLAKLYIQTLYLAQHNIDLIPDTDVLFPNIESRDTFISPSDIDSFDAARELFKKAMAALNTAKTYFVLDGYVTDHIRLLQSQSRCYAKLIPFEPDRKRQMAMHQKRIDVYEPILTGEFNLNAYGYLLQEIYYEVGEIYSALHDLKVVHWTRPYMETNAFAVDSIRYFERFLQLYYYQQGKSDAVQDLPSILYLPTHLDAKSPEDLKPFYNGVFFLTRVYGKVQFADDSKTVFYWTKCLELHENLLKSVPALQLDDFFTDELAISQEMVLLLPEKINHLHYKRRRL